MRSISELEEIVSRVNPDAGTSIYDSLEGLGQGEVDVDGAYQQILEAIVYDILKTPKK